MMLEGGRGFLEVVWSRERLTTAYDKCQLTAHKSQLRGDDPFLL